VSEPRTGVVFAENDSVQVVSGKHAGKCGHICACPMPASLYHGQWECEWQCVGYVYVAFEDVVQRWRLGGTSMSANWLWIPKTYLKRR
jgi:hypothetical protein